MSSPEKSLQIPTFGSLSIAPIVNPSSKDMHSLYEDLAYEMMVIADTVSDLSRARASRALNNSFYENLDAEIDAEISLQGVKALFTKDPVMIREAYEAEHGRSPNDEEYTPDIVGFTLFGNEVVQGFFNTFSTGPVINIESRRESYLDFAFCVSIENPLITIPEATPEDTPNFMVGNWLAVLQPESTIGIVQ